MPTKQIIEISSGTIVRFLLFVLLIIFLYYLRGIIGIVLFSVVVASAVEPATKWFERRKIPRTLGVIFVYLVAFLVLSVIFYLVVPTFFSEISSFASDIPGYLENPNLFDGVFKFLPISEGSLQSILKEFASVLKNSLSSISAGFFQTVSNIFGGAVSFLLIVVLSFYLSVQKDGLENFLKIVTPVKYENYILGLWKRARDNIGKWMQGQILLGILIGIFVYLGLSIMRVEYALSFALLAAVFELIPIFGPILAAIPAVIIAFLQSPPLALVVILFYVIIQQFENHLIYPLVVRKIVGVPPIMVILAIIIGGSVGGFFGILLAVPIATTLREFLNDVMMKKKTVHEG